MTEPAAALDPAPPSRNGVLAVLRKTPVTILFVLTLLVIGVVTGTLFSPAQEKPWFESVATGLPAFAEGRWWSVFSSPFFVDHPLTFLTLAPLVIGGIGWAEWRFGSLRTLGLFWAGHLVGVLGAAALVALAAPSGWPWAVRLAEAYDVGPSCGAFAALIFAIATLPAPWRLRARVVVVGWIGISLLYFGQLFDLEHAVAMIVALAVSGWLPRFRRPAGRPSEREWRLVAFAGLIAIGAIQIIDLAIPSDGPLGQNHPTASFADVAVDVVVIALVANGVRRGYRFAWVATMLLGAYNVVTAILVFLAIPLLVDAGIIENAGEVLGLVIAPTLFWVAITAFMFVGRGAWRVPLRASRRVPQAAHLSRDEMAERLRRFGGGTISWMATWPANSHLATTAGGAIAYQAHAGVAIALGDPVVPAGTHRAALEEFTRATERAGLVPCVFSASSLSADERPEGWRSVVIAEDTIVDLPGLELSGKRWQPIRTSVNRAAREGVEFRMCTLTEEPWNVLAQVRAISEQWTGDKGLPEMRFTLGTVDEALDPETRVGIAVDAEGNLHGVTSWLPVYGREQTTSVDGGSAHGDAEEGEPGIVGWTLDVMRRRDGGFGPVMEFLIASAALHFAEAGYRFVSLSGAPLVRPADAEAGPVDRLLDRLGELIEPLYGFRSLHKFKQKFNPRSEPLHLLYRDEGDLPRIAMGLTRAYLPDATLRELVASAAGAAAPRESR